MNISYEVCKIEENKFGKYVYFIGEYLSALDISTEYPSG
jgi:hypothetical protein